jgi:hypothetical protein
MKHKYIVLEKSQTRVRPYQRKGKYVIGYTRETPGARERFEIRERMGMRAPFEMDEYSPYGQPFKVTMTPEEKLKWAHRKEHHDVGAKIGGAKKDIWAEISASNIKAVEEQGVKVAYYKVTKQAVFAPLDPETEKQLGVSPGAAYMKQQFLGAVAGRPPDSPEMREAFVHRAEFLQGSLNNCKSVADIVNFISEFDQLRQMRKPDRVISAVEFEKLSLTEGTHQYHDDMKALKALGYSSGARAERISGGNEYRIYAPTEDTTFNNYLKSLGDRVTTIVTDSARGHGFYSFGKKTSVFWTRDWRMARKMEKENDWSWTGKKEQAEKQKRFEWERKVSSEIERKGGDSAPPSTTADNILKSYNLRGVEYGNWISDDDAKYHIQHAWEALSDLADILGVEKADVSLKGELALAIGARGAGKARAHYEPMKKVINLTKFSGGGCAAHEWGHALDNILAEAIAGEKGKTEYLSAGAVTSADPKYKDIIYAFQNVMSTIKKGAINNEQRQAELSTVRSTISVLRKTYYDLPSDYKNPTSDTAKKKEQARVALNDSIREYNKISKDKSTKYYRAAEILGPYWARPTELFARAFESYVEDKLEENGRASTYLVSGTKFKYGTKVQVKGAEREIEPYPQGEERIAFNKAIENLMVAIRGSDSLKKALISLFNLMK